MSHLVHHQSTTPTPGIDPELIRDNRAASKADETKRALLKNWSLFESWCDAQGVSALPATADVVEAFLLYLADHHSSRKRNSSATTKGLKTASVCQALWAVNARHRMAGFPPPGDTIQVKTALAGIKRRKGSRKKQQEPLTIEHIRRIRFPSTLKGKRDKAILLLGFAGCFRRSELVALKAEDVRNSAMGIRIFLERSKTDQEGEGSWVHINAAVQFTEFCPVIALREWLDAAGINRGVIFRSLTKGKTPRIGEKLSAVSVDATVKWAARECGFDPKNYGGHSLRAGSATFLSERGKTPTLIAKHGRWKSLDMVLTYCRGETARELHGVY